MEYNINEVDKCLERLLDTNRNSLISDLNNALQEGAQIIEIIYKSIVYCKEQIAQIKSLLELHQENIDEVKLKQQLCAFENNLMIWNLCGHLQNVSIDIKKIQSKLYSDELPLIRCKSIGEAYMIIYESSKVLVDNTGVKLRDYIKAQLVDELDGFLAAFDAHRKKLTTFRGNYSELLKRVRVAITAHYDNDMANQLAIMENLSWSDTISILTEYEKIILGFGPLFFSLIKYGINNLQSAFPAI